MFDLKTGLEKEIAKRDIKWGYRSTSLSKRYFITEVSFKLKKSSLAKVMQLISARSVPRNKRNNSHKRSLSGAF